MLYCLHFWCGVERFWLISLFHLKIHGACMSKITKNRSVSYSDSLVTLYFFTMSVIICFTLLTWPQEEVYQSRQGWRLQGSWVCGLEDIARQWKGRSALWSRMSKHWTSRDLTPPSQFLEHWEKKCYDCYSEKQELVEFVCIQLLWL